MISQECTGHLAPLAAFQRENGRPFFGLCIMYPLLCATLLLLGHGPSFLHRGKRQRRCLDLIVSQYDHSFTRHPLWRRRWRLLRRVAYVLHHYCWRRSKQTNEKKKKNIDHTKKEILLVLMLILFMNGKNNKSKTDNTSHEYHHGK